MKMVATAIFVAIAAAATIAHSQEMSSKVLIDDGVYTTEQAVRGEERYRAMCARCHGRKLSALYAEVPGLASYAFRSNWPGRSVGELFDTIRYTMPKIARQTMPRGRIDQKEFLDPQLAADLTAYILSFNGFAAGVEELPPSATYLHQIEITTPPAAAPGSY